MKGNRYRSVHGVWLNNQICLGTRFGFSFAKMFHGLPRWCLGAALENDSKGLLGGFYPVTLSLGRRTALRMRNGGQKK